MIIKENRIKLEDINEEFKLNIEEAVEVDQIIFFDLEHYVYKKPKCIGVFGAAIYSKVHGELLVTQYMIENKREVKDILYLALNYFKEMKEKGKMAISTFSGNNDFTVIKYLFNKFNIEYDFEEEFLSIDLQKFYEIKKGTSIGLKKLEKIFEIEREGEVISGSTLAKTFYKVLKDSDYIKRMPYEKIEKILLYNEQDVVNLFYIFLNWEKYIVDNEDEEIDVVEEAEEKAQD
ncbi:MAG: ribonuclease H-like domain-containing protein [Clostridium sp.]|uniref:ribonuclease H-like domain-containing protein n=1 Tax=Clostridium sp. TaxID=1506 RepID=UPI003F2E5897